MRMSESTPHTGEVVTNMSQESKRMSRPVRSGMLEDLEEELSRLKKTKQELEFGLSAYGKSAELKKQKEIRDNYPRRESLDRWIEEKAKMEAERNKILTKKINVDQRINVVKPRVKELRRQRGETEDAQKNKVFVEMLAELRSIRVILEKVGRSG